MKKWILVRCLVALSLSFSAEEKRFICIELDNRTDECKGQFNFFELSRHLTECHKEHNQYNHACPDCNVAFMSNTALQAHVCLTHNKENTEIPLCSYIPEIQTIRSTHTPQQCTSCTAILMELIASDAPQQVASKHALSRFHYLAKLAEQCYPKELFTRFFIDTLRQECRPHIQAIRSIVMGKK